MQNKLPDMGTVLGMTEPTEQAKNEEASAKALRMRMAIPSMLHPSFDFAATINGLTQQTGNATEMWRLKMELLQYQER